MCPYKSQREEITISLTVPAMVSKQYVGKPSSLQRHIASLCSSCSAWGPPSHVLQICLSVSQPPDSVLHGLILHHMVYVWLKLVHFVAIYFSSMLWSLWKIALLSTQRVVRSSLVWISFWHNHVKLWVITYRKIQGSVIHNWLPGGFHWTCQSSHLATQFVFNTFSVLTEFRLLNEEIVWKSNENLVTVKANDVHWSHVTCKTLSHCRRHNLPLVSLLWLQSFLCSSKAWMQISEGFSQPPSQRLKWNFRVSKVFLSFLRWHWSAPSALSNALPLVQLSG